MTAIASAAGVSRRVLYEHFGSRDGLIIDAATQLMDDELLDQIPPDTTAGAGAVIIARHFVDHETFYRALITGSSAHEATEAILALLRRFGANSVRRLYDDLDDGLAEEVAEYLNGATAMAMARWLSTDGTRDPDEFGALMDRIESVFRTAPRHRANA